MLAKCAGRPEDKGCPVRQDCIRYKIPAIVAQVWVIPEVKWHPFQCKQQLKEDDE